MLSGAIVTNIGRSPEKGFAAPRTVISVAWGTPVSFANVARGSAAIADAAPAATPSKRPRVSPTPRTVVQSYRAGRRGPRQRAPPRLGRSRAYVGGAEQEPLTVVDADAPSASVAVTSITTGPSYDPHDWLKPHDHAPVASLVATPVSEPGGLSGTT